MELGEPEAVNFTRKPSSIFSALHSTRILICIFFALTSHVLSPFLLFPFSSSPSASPVPYYVARTLVSRQLFSS